MQQVHEGLSTKSNQGSCIMTALSRGGRRCIRGKKLIDIEIEKLCFDIYRIENCLGDGEKLKESRLVYQCN